MNILSKNFTVKKLAGFGIILGLVGVGISVMSEDLLDISIDSRDQNKVAGSVGNVGSIVDPDLRAIDDNNVACIAVLDDSSAKSFIVDDKASISAEPCLININSAHHNAMETYKESVIEIAQVGSADDQHEEVVGLFERASSNISPIIDPLRDRAPPTFGDCDYTDVVLKGGAHILHPGVYCGGIVALASEKIQLERGVYIMKDGPLIVGGSATLSGDNVGFFFHGESSVFAFGRATKLELKASKRGPMAGILFFEDRETRYNREFAIRSSNTDLLEGAVYLPRGRLVIDTTGNIGGRSKWTAIVARQIQITGSPAVALNSRSSVSDAQLLNELEPVREIAFVGNY